MTFSLMSTFYIGDIFTDVYILRRKERIRFSIYYMVPTSKCLDVGDYICAVVQGPVKRLLSFAWPSLVAKRLRRPSFDMHGR